MIRIRESKLIPGLGISDSANYVNSLLIYTTFIPIVYKVVTETRIL